MTTSTLNAQASDEGLLDVLNALFFIESFDGEPFNLNARKGKGGGQSIAGVTNQTFKWMKRTGMIPASSERFNSKDEVRAGMTYFQWLLDRPYIKGDVIKALAAYHMGPTAFRDLVRFSGGKWRAHLPEKTEIHLTNVQGLINNSRKTFLKYEIDSTPVYEPLVEVLFETL